jgi:hypothetical protein
MTTANTMAAARRAQNLDAYRTAYGECRVLANGDLKMAGRPDALSPERVRATFRYWKQNARTDRSWNGMARDLCVRWAARVAKLDGR